jgi:hypothetical protein
MRRESYRAEQSIRADPWAMGHAAFRGGSDQSVNPFKSVLPSGRTSENHQLWVIGWEDARNEFEERKHELLRNLRPLGRWRMSTSP